MFRWIVPVVILVYVLSAVAPAFGQCAMCVTGLTQSKEGQRMARSYNQAILFLLAFPYAIVMTFAGLILHARAQARGLTLWDWLIRRRRSARS